MNITSKLTDADIEYVHTTHSRLISIDGCDGVGKTTLGLSFRNVIQLYSTDELVVIEPNLFQGSARAVMLGSEFCRRRASLSDEDINRYFLAACQANYDEIVHPALERGAWVVLISSDLRALAFTLAERSQNIAAYTREVVRRGTLTRGLQPKYRCILEAEPEALLERVSGRGGSDDFDPTTIQGYQRRIASVEEAIVYMQALSPATLWRHIPLRTVPTDHIALYMDTIADDLTQWITEGV